MSPISNRRKQAGVTLMEVTLSLGLLTGAMVGLSALMANYSDDLRAAQTAEQLRDQAQAYRRYIRDNFNTIWVATNNGNNTVLLEHANLTAANYLAPGGTNLNPFSQATCALVRQVGGRLQALVVTEGGTVINNADLGAIVTMAGASAGAMYTPDGAAALVNVQGARGGWRLAVADYDNRANSLAKNCRGQTGTVRLQAGRLAYALWFEDTSTQNGALMRDEVPGAPVLNRMNTPLVLNAVQTVGGACATAGAVSRNAEGAVVYCAGTVWQKVASTAFWGDPVDGLGSLPACTAAKAGSTHIVRPVPPATRPSAYTCNGTAWEALATDVNGNLNVPRSLTVNQIDLSSALTVGTACDQLASVSRSAAGELLICKPDGGGGRIWTTIGLTECRDLTNADLNSFLPPLGQEACGQGGNLTNAPIAGGALFYVKTQRHRTAGNAAMQTATMDQTNRTFSRLQLAGIWTKWSEMTPVEVGARTDGSACDVSRDLLARDAAGQGSFLTCNTSTGRWVKPAGASKKLTTQEIFVSVGSNQTVERVIAAYCRDFSPPILTGYLSLSTAHNYNYQYWCAGELWTVRIENGPNSIGAQGTFYFTLISLQ